MNVGDRLKKTLSQAKSTFSNFVGKIGKNIDYNVQALVGKKGTEAFTKAWTPPQIAAQNKFLKTTGSALQNLSKRFETSVDKGVSDYQKSYNIQTKMGAPAPKFNLPQYLNPVQTPDQAAATPALGGIVKLATLFPKSYGFTAEAVATKGLKSVNPINIYKDFKKGGFFAALGSEEAENIFNLLDIPTAGLFGGGVKLLKVGSKAAGKLDNIFDIVKVAEKAGKKNEFLGELVRRGNALLDTPSGYVKMSDGRNLLNVGRLPKKYSDWMETTGDITRGNALWKQRNRGLFSSEAGEMAAEEIAKEPMTVKSLIKIVNDALQEQKPLLSSQERLRTVERARRFNEARDVGVELSPLERLAKRKSVLEGELPKVDAKALENTFGASGLNKALDVVEKANLLTTEKINAGDALVKLWSGELVTDSERILLKTVFPEDFITTLSREKGILKKIGKVIGEVLGVPKAFMASLDIVPAFRQGIFLIGRPRRFAGSVAEGTKYYFNSKYFDDAMMAIRSSPDYDLAKEAGLELTEAFGANSMRDEQFMSNLAEKIPVLSDLIVKPSTRGYNGMLNKLRYDVFTDELAKARAAGYDSIEFQKSLAEYVNTATGRGSLGRFDKAFGDLSKILFSPKLIASRVGLMNPAFYVKLHPQVRKAAIKDLLTFSGTVLSTLTIAKLAGAKVGTDPTSADFGKIRIGDTRYDITGGFQQYLVLGARLLTQKYTSSSSGKTYKLGEGYRPPTSLDMIGRFFEAKQAPVVSFVTDVLRGQTVIGEDFELPKAIADRFIPMIAADIVDLYKEGGLKDIPGIIPALFGVGMSTYPDKKKSSSKPTKSAISPLSGTKPKPMFK